MIYGPSLEGPSFVKYHLEFNPTGFFEFGHIISYKSKNMYVCIKKFGMISNKRLIILHSIVLRFRSQMRVFYARAE